MEVRGQPRALAALVPVKEPPVFTIQGAEWAPEPLLTFWGRDKSLAPPENRNTIPQLSSMQPGHYSKLSIPVIIAVFITCQYCLSN
jgi:hypothetical protein